MGGFGADGNIAERKSLPTSIRRPEMALSKNISASIHAGKLINAEPNLCWRNAAKLMLRNEFEHASYVEGTFLFRKATLPIEHGWLVLNGEIIDPTLPEWEIAYFMAHEWCRQEFLPLYFCGSLPFFRRVEFLTRSVQVEMDKARAKAIENALTWK